MTENDFQAKYADLLGDPTGVQIEKVIAYLAHELPYFWLDEYLAMTAWTPNVSVSETDRSNTFSMRSPTAVRGIRRCMIA